MKVPQHVIERLVRHALEEDAPYGDLTSQTLIPAEAQMRAELRAREEGVLCGEAVFTAAMTLTGQTRVHFHCCDGNRFAEGDLLATVEGPAQCVLQAERIALNFVQRLSGIATMTSRYVAETAGTRARIVDTRKTTPGLRILERYAVRCGGGGNHRFSLSDAVLVKDNHLQVLSQTGSANLIAALLSLRQRIPHTATIEVEVDRIDQIEPVLAGNVDTILLDNFSVETLQQAVRQIAGRARTEASGGVTLSSIRAIASTGVDLISVGALTHSVRSLDLGLDMEVL